MDYQLRCNSLKCRSQLTDRAVVTTCSHIFCPSCASSSGLSSSTGPHRTCPACSTKLTRPDDAAETSLDPSEDYKTSVLSGLSPGVVVECASRALAFYWYQATQEIFYQEFQAKNLKDKYQLLSGQMDQIIHDANAEIVALRNRVASLDTDYQTLKRKNNDLMEAYDQKVAALNRAQTASDTLKRERLQSDAMHAAEDTVKSVLSQHTPLSQRHTQRPVSNMRRVCGYSPLNQDHVGAEDRRLGGASRSSPLFVPAGSPVQQQHRSRLPVAVPHSSPQVNCNTDRGAHMGQPRHVIAPSSLHVPRTRHGSRPQGDALRQFVYR